MINPKCTLFYVADILRKWRPDLKGYSLGTGETEEWFNAAVPGARAR